MQATILGRRPGSSAASFASRPRHRPEVRRPELTTVLDSSSRFEWNANDWSPTSLESFLQERKANNRQFTSRRGRTIESPVVAMSRLGIDDRRRATDVWKRAKDPAMNQLKTVFWPCLPSIESRNETRKARVETNPAESHCYLGIAIIALLFSNGPENLLLLLHFFSKTARGRAVGQAVCLFVLRKKTEPDSFRRHVACAFSSFSWLVHGPQASGKLQARN
uniref:Uncharacterized protein n=1 Tax=Peronospora matthiolae TaxID=2874970 RepID=A0AAV1UZ97_9STRA